MSPNGWLQISLVLALTFLAAVPLGRYIAAALAGRMAWLAPVERGFLCTRGREPSTRHGMEGLRLRAGHAECGASPRAPLAGEQALSYGSQMWGLTVHNFLSAATGMAAAAAVARAFAVGSLTSLGNFWADLTRITLYVLLPLRSWSPSS